MSSIASEIISQATKIQEPVWQSVSSSFSAASNATVTVKDPGVTALEQDDLIALGATRQIIIEFAFSHLPENIQVIVIDEGQFAALLSETSGNLVASISEAVLTDSRGLLESIVQGICLGAGTIKGEPVAAIQLSIRMSAFLAPENFLKSLYIIQSTGVLTDESTKMECRWLFDADSLNSILRSEDTSSKPFSGKASPSEVGSSGRHAEDSSMQLLMDIPLEISVELGRVKMVVRDVLELGAGSIVEIDKAAGEPVDVLVNGRHVARGEVVVIEDNFGVRITEILNPAERLAKLNEAA